jgi:hypothetical protein
MYLASKQRKKLFTHLFGRSLDFHTDENHQTADSAFLSQNLEQSARNKNSRTFLHNLSYKESAFESLDSRRGAKRLGNGRNIGKFLITHRLCTDPTLSIMFLSPNIENRFRF